MSSISEFSPSDSSPPERRRSLWRLNWLVFVIPLIALGIAWRFIGLANSPPGFYVDEAAITAQVICLRQSGADLSGRSLPLFSQVLGGGFATPGYLYIGALWTSVFGDSITAMRAMAAFFGGMTVIGVFFLALRFWRSREIAWLCTLCASLSPWGFQFSRIAWDPPLAPCFFVWSLFFLLNNRTSRAGPRILNGVAGGWLAALAMYSYPPLRVQVVMVLPLILFLSIRNDRESSKKAPWFIGSFILALLPLTWLTFTGELQGRFNMLSIFNEGYLREHGGSSLSNIAKIFIENVWLNISPRYLFLTGDGNLRHSSQAVGQWSWVEMLGFAGALALLLRRRLPLSKKSFPLLLILIWGYFAAILPAALTWESNPHALRSIGAYPFLALLAGWCLYHLAALGRIMKSVILACATAFAIWFGLDYMRDYPARSELWFEKAVSDRAQELARIGRAPEIKNAIREMYPDYPDLAIAYYELHYGTRTCQ